MADLNGSELKLDHTFVVRGVLHRGRVASLYQATWKPFDLHVVVRALDQMKGIDVPIGVEQRIETATTERTGRVRGATFGDVVDAGRARGAAFVILRVPPGQLLQTRLDQQVRLEPLEVAELVADVAAALRACRQTGTPHRAPTPDRVWLANDGSAFLLGLGDALYREETLIAGAPATPDLLWHLPPESFAFAADARREDGTGPLRVFAPEDARRLRAIEDGLPAEVYALAALAWHCLCGHHPFFVNSTDATHGVRATLQGEPAGDPALDSLPLVRECLLRALDRTPEHRPATPEAFAAELRTAVEGRSIPIHRTAAHLAAGADDDDELEHDDVFVSRPPGANEAGAPVAVGVAPAWKLAALVLLAGAMTAVLLGLMRRETFLVTTTPPGALVQEVVGHVASDLGRSPVLLRGRSPAAPIVLRTVTNAGEPSADVMLSPLEMTDLGRCRTVDLELVFDDAIEGTGDSP